MKTAYKIRFIPLAVTLFIFIILLITRLGAKLPISGKTLWWSGGAVFAAFIFMQFTRENERDKQKVTNEPALTESENKSNEIRAEIKLQSGNNIPIAALKLTFGVIVTALSATMLSGETLWLGLFGTAIGILAVIIYTRRLRYYIKRLRELKSENEK